jgi:glyoxylate/hydroxypyruvate reductase
MPTIALISPDFDLRPQAPRLRAALPGHRIAVWPEDDVSDAEIALAWEPPQDVLHAMPNLRLLQGVAAGVDNLIDRTRPGPWKICRVVDPQQPASMEQYVLWAVLHFHRHFDVALANQARQAWRREPPKRTADFRIGVMGMGEIGLKVAEGLARRGYPVSGWSRTLKRAEGVRTFDESGYADFLGQLDVLVCLLPLTEQTRGILDRRTFDALPSGSALVHVGRGDHLVPGDLIDALQRGHLRGAVLDVFPKEPLPEGHPLWSTPGVVVTPHMATMADQDAVLEQALVNIRIAFAGSDDFINQVDPARGY